MHWQQIIDGMEAVVHDPKKGTARDIRRGLNYRIAGKTGTAQVVGIAQGEEYDADALLERQRDHALFVGFAIPMSMLMSFVVIGFLGETINTMVLFGLIMGLGMLVDNGIVVVENAYRLMEKDKMNSIEAAKKGIGEIAYPIIISTATTVAAFLPLGFWPGVIGEFMIFFPITLSIVLGSSLVVAIFFNSMLVSKFMKIDKNEISLKSLKRLSFILGGIGIILIFNMGVFRAGYSKSCDFGSHLLNRIGDYDGCV